MAKKRAMTAHAESGIGAKFIDAFLIDLNGIERGKRLPAKDAAKVEKSALRFPRSLIGVDVWALSSIRATAMACVHWFPRA